MISIWIHGNSESFGIFMSNCVCKRINIEHLITEQEVFCPLEFLDCAHVSIIIHLSWLITVLLLYPNATWSVSMV